MAPIRFRPTAPWWNCIRAPPHLASEQNGYGVQWVGDHIRPRVRVPTSWHWPVGVSLSTEIGYQRPVYSLDTWTWGDPSDRRQGNRPLVLCF